MGKTELGEGVQEGGVVDRVVCLGDVELGDGVVLSSGVGRVPEDAVYDLGNVGAGGFRSEAPLEGR